MTDPTQHYNDDMIISVTHKGNFNVQYGAIRRYDIVDLRDTFNFVKYITKIIK